MKYQKSYLLMLFAFLAFTSCDEITPTADKELAQKTESMMQQANSLVGMPDVVNFTEKKLMNMLYELRDQPKFQTFTYTVDMNGNLHELCRSVGYGIPYSAQSTNPEKIVRRQTSSYGTLPQPEPNGLFMPDGLSATWVICTDPGSGKIAPMYVEPNIIVSPFKLKSISQYYANIDKIQKELNEIAKETAKLTK